MPELVIGRKLCLGFTKVLLIGIGVQLYNFRRPFFHWKSSIGLVSLFRQAVSAIPSLVRISLTNEMKFYVTLQKISSAISL